MHIVCSGYRDPLDQNFRDESASVVKRAQKSYKTASHGAVTLKTCTPEVHSDSNYADSWDETTLELRQRHSMSSSNVLFGLPQSVEKVALAYFMSAYIPGSHYEYLPFIYGQADTEILSATVRATSIASLARETGQTSLMEMARRSYAKALLDTNATLANPATTTNDTTLISVLLLSLFEAIAWSSPRPPQSWTTHTQGALALIRIRGSEQFKTLIGRQLFIQVANIICINSIQQRKRLPPDLVDLIKLAEQSDEGALKYRLAFLTGDVSNLLADIDEGVMTPEEVIRATQSLDAQYVSFCESFPPACKYQKIRLEKSRPEVYGMIIHRYPSQRITQLWNSCRMTRILLNEIIHAHALHVPSQYGAPIRTLAAHNLQNMATDICASIPQLIDPSIVPILPDSRMNSPLAPLTESILESTSPKAVAASLLWPLSATRSASLASEDVRAYAVQQLNSLGREFHLPQTENVTLGQCEFDALQDGLHMFYVS